MVEVSTAETARPVELDTLEPEPLVENNDDGRKNKTGTNTVKSTSQAAPSLRLTYMVLSFLNKRDVFGLEHLGDDETLQPAERFRYTKSGNKKLIENNDKIILISEESGAELIVINKRFFSMCADVATLLRIDKLVNETGPFVGYSVGIYLFFLYRKQATTII